MRRSRRRTGFAKSRTLIYKRTHTGDPDARGCFGINGCMGRVRDWPFDAVIGVGGIGDEPTANGIANRVTWIGIGARKSFGRDPRGPHVTFDHFLLLDRRSPVFTEMAPELARRVYSRNIRATMRLSSAAEAREVAAILELAKKSPPSRGVPASEAFDDDECGDPPGCRATRRRRSETSTVSSCRAIKSKPRHNDC